MASFNDIPEHLREKDVPELSELDVLRRGCIATGIAAIVIGAMVCLMSYWVPMLLMPWMLAIAWPFLMTWILFSVMHSSTGVVSGSCNLVVVALAFLVVLAKHFVIVLAIENVQFSPASLLIEGILLNYFAWVGVGLAIYRCHDGNSSLLGLTDLLITNRLSGRRL